MTGNTEYAKQVGKKAFEDGIDQSENPYPTFSIMHYAWDIGYNEACGYCEKDYHSTDGCVVIKIETDDIDEFSECEGLRLKAVKHHFPDGVYCHTDLVFEKAEKA